jgi:hypothetical protein
VELDPEGESEDRGPDLVELGDGVAELLDLRVGGGDGAGGHRDPRLREEEERTGGDFR